MHPVSALPPLPRWLVAGAILLALALSGLIDPALIAQVNVKGQWRTLVGNMPINPVHIALMRTGNVLVVAGSGNDPNVTNFQAGVWDPQANTIVTQPLGWDMFCNGMVALPDGRILINGGNLKYDPFWGERRNAIFDPSTSIFTNVQMMLHGRWYPTVTVLGNGRVMTFSGLNESGATNTAVEIYTPGVGWSQEYTANWTPPLYPRMHLLTDGRVAAVASQAQLQVFDPDSKTWTAGATTNYGSSRTYGSSVLLPLKSSDGYKSRVLILGGGNPATRSTEILDMSAATPTWQNGPLMSQARIEMDATILPNGKILAMGGSLNDEDSASASLNADLYDPTTNTFSSAGTNAMPRLYHSGSLLLPDATVVLMGGNPTRGTYEGRIEIYSPAYLFQSDGSAAARPTITGVSSITLDYGNTFQVQTPDAASIAKVVLVRPGSSTHAFDMEQRLVELDFTQGSGVLNVTAPPHGNVAPPGYYMLFVLNSAGVPSVATFVQIRTDTTAPGAPPNLVATANNTVVTLTWQAASDNVGVSKYRIERCTGSGCSTFAEIATTTSLSYVNGGLAPTTSYTYRVRATDVGGNLGPYSNTATVTTGAGTSSVGLVAAYAFEEGSGTTVADASGNGNTGSITAATWSTAGKFGKALSFNGTSARVLIPDSPTLDLTSAFTLEGWAFPTATQAVWRTLVDKDVDRYYLMTSSDATGGPAVGGTFTNGTQLYAPAALAANTWTHLAATYDRTTLRLYVNGVQVASRSSTTAVDTSANNLNIGANSYGEYFAGRIDEVRVYNRALTVNEIQTDMATPITTTGSNQAPTATITNPTGNVSVNPGQTVSFTGTGTDPDGSISGYAWSFPGGSPSSSTAASPGSITYSTPGTYTASLTVTDNGGASSSPATRTVTVGDFTIAASPASQTVSPGANTTYTVTVTPDAAFTGTVTFSVTGLPAGASAGFNPTSISPSGQTTLTVSTSGTTPTGSYPLSVRGTSGPVTRTAPVTLAVSTPSNQAPTATITSPTGNVTIAAGGTVSFAGTGSDPDGSIASYAWSFPGGTPSSSTSATPGTVTYASAGTYTASLTVTDNGGASSSPATRTVTVTGSGTLPPGLVAAYGFEEGAGPTVADASGNGNTGTITAATWTTAGKFGKALSFNGTSARVVVVDSASLHLTSAFTLEGWAFPTAAQTGWHTLVDKDVDRYYLMTSSDNASSTPAVGGTFTNGTQLYAPAALAANTWTHLAATYDRVTLRLYVNGLQVASRAMTTAIATSANNLNIGANSYGEYFTGLIDEVRVYNRALTASEIKTDMATALSSLTASNQSPTPAIAGDAANVATNAGAGYAGSWQVSFDPLRPNGDQAVLRAAGVRVRRRWSLPAKGR